MMLENCSWLAQIQQKKNCPKQMDYVQDISNPVGQGSMLIYLLTGRRELNAVTPTTFNRETNNNIAANNKIIIHSGTYTPSLHPLAPPRLNSISHLHGLRRNVIIMTLPWSPFVGCGSMIVISPILLP